MRDDVRVKDVVIAVSCLFIFIVIMKHRLWHARPRGTRNYKPLKINRLPA
ncbi:hypothetical protein MICA_1593 [Micavibrio aeruginosavorus ARL-13]|uniref:Uncharacterized protein n=1 Tax=Micavibrio aeruginosavorus (strain ARL-13) TaxID=856793 RepID=G2KPT9_MICAA|nr:hypothetical protein MICA_1593 [Micavibrio aeruginosavorus ARL-13]